MYRRVGSDEWRDEFDRLLLDNDLTLHSSNTICLRQIVLLQWKELRRSKKRNIIRMQFNLEEMPIFEG